MNILDKLEAVEKEHGVTVLYACESGSRAYGFASEDSDYDVRFIYAHPMDWYLSINEGKDNIVEQDGDIDLCGWDLRKALRLAAKSNTGLMEMLYSPIVYKTYYNFVPCLKAQMKNYSRKAAAHHYANYAASCNISPFRDNRIKDYLYAIRGLLCVDYLNNLEYFDDDFPPMTFDELVSQVVKNGTIMKRDIDDLLIHKSAGKGKGVVNILHLDVDIPQRIRKARDIADSLPSNKVNVENLNTIFRAIVRYIK